jgi:hypothetical protein
MRKGTPVRQPTQNATIVVRIGDIPAWNELLVAVGRVVNYNDPSLPGMGHLRDVFYSILNPPRPTKLIETSVHEIHFVADPLLGEES